ncbi:acetate kinase [bacterium endosymbiont of Pedicinus badii]|uniref:acetate kinase n=1 Tax=bacterium endosymbiont of Pedicinus badii TaxID=1719126 RepID=UPI0009B96F3B|nr:acetate kinase [bacterium endosymbiont of Pedicinus badii]OQM34458.1 acetate kinase [bacterium endosymbiont of Pedicinus badii]
MKNLVFVVNCGSSSLKFAIIDPIKEEKKIFGIAENFGLSNTRISWNLDSQNFQKSLKKYSNHEESLKFIKKRILKNNVQIFDNIFCIGHRIVHGGKFFKKPTLITEDVLKKIEELIPFAPLHNPANLSGIDSMQKEFPKLKKKNVAVFDTSFFYNLPKIAFLYSIPYYFYKKYSIRKYGAHGISHCYIFQKMKKFLNISKKKINLISCHLGNGSSISAIKRGKCIETSMGFTPLEGLMMGTRSGDIDPAIIFYMQKYLKISLNEIENILIKKSGLLGISGISNDCREIEKQYYKNNKFAKIAVSMYCYKIIKYIGAYIALIGEKIDAIVLTGGIGENSVLIRSIIINNLEYFGYKIDVKKNSSKIKKLQRITKSKNSIFVVPANEELIIAKETYYLIKKNKNAIKKK